MKDTDQIAAEAWKQITDYADNCEDAIGDLQGDTNCIGFIKAAIEKVVEDLRNTNVNLLRSLNAAQQESRAAHASGLPRLIHRNGEVRWEYQNGEESAIICVMEPTEASRLCKAYYEVILSKPAHASEL